MAVPAIEFIVQVSAFVSTVAWLTNGGGRTGRFEHISEQEEGILLGGDVRIMTRLNACILERPARKEACEPSSRIVRHPTKRAVRSVGSVYPTKLAA